MRKGIWPAAAALIVLVSGAGVVIGVPRGRAADTTVDMRGNGSDPTTTWRFAPEEITVPVGGTIVWVNKSDQAHTATADNGAFKSNYLNKGETFQFTATAPGDIRYYCEPHQSLGMVGVIHVTGSTGTTVPTTATTVPGSTPTSATTATTGAGASTTTTAAAGATTTTAATGATTTSAPAANASTTPTSSADQSSTTTTTAATPGGEAAAGANGGGHRKTDTGDSSPIGIAFAAVATLLLGGVAAKLFTSKGH